MHAAAAFSRVAIEGFTVRAGRAGRVGFSGVVSGEVVTTSEVGREPGRPSTSGTVGSGRMIGIDRAVFERGKRGGAPALDLPRGEGGTLLPRPAEATVTCEAATPLWPAVAAVAIVRLDGSDSRGDWIVLAYAEEGMPLRS